MDGSGIVVDANDTACHHNWDGRGEHCKVQIENCKSAPLLNLHFALCNSQPPLDFLRPKLDNHSFYKVRFQASLGHISQA
jgi:hypothetical protein